MNRSVEGSGGTTPSDEGSGLAALRRSSAFRGPVAPADEVAHSNDHLALIYESRAEQWDAVVPFVREGLERGERVVYIAAENEPEDVLAALREDGVDADAAVESGDLLVRPVEDAYLEGGEFDLEDAFDMLADVVEEAGEGYEGLRVSAEETWLLEAEDAVEEFMELESRVNELFCDRASMALCQYDRDRMPPEVVDEVLRTHPHLVVDNTVSQNVYYEPPESYVGPEDTASAVDRKLQSLRERTEAKAELAEHRRHLRELYETTAEADRSFEEKVGELLDLGRERFDLDVGLFLRREGDRLRVVEARGVDLAAGEATLSADPDHFCEHTLAVDAPVGVTDTSAVGWDDDPVYERFELGCYLGTTVTSGDDVYGTVSFAAVEPRDREFTEAEYTFLDLMGQWLSNELERRQYERDLEETVAQLRKSNDRLQQFAYAASHDLQEPLRMVSSYLQLLERRYGDELDDEAAEWIEYAVEGADSMREMVDDLLAYSRVEQSDRSFEPVDCEAVVDQVTDDLQVQIEENDATVAVDDLPEVTADPEHLRQLFSNLVSNAIKYNESDRPRVEITAAARPDCWEVSVSDDGIGIDPDDEERIFEVFKRLHHGDDYAGTGVGLALCQEIVETHGGEIWVESDPGEGSTFTFTLPRRSAD